MARVLDNHPDGQGIVDIHEESVSVVVVEAGRVCLSYSINVCCEVSVFTIEGAGERKARGAEREGVERKGRDRRGRRGGNGCLNIICMQKPVLPDSCIVHDVQRYTFHCSQVNMFGNNLQIGPHM